MHARCIKTTEGPLKSYNIRCKKSIKSTKEVETLLNVTVLIQGLE